MSTTILYTTAESIRSTIGIDTDDISDVMLLAQNLDSQMLERLDDFLPDHENVYDATEAGARRLSLWCQYFGALQLLEDSLLGIPQKIQANTDQVSRFQVDFEALKSSLANKLRGLEHKLAPPVGTATIALMGVSIPGYDPVVG